MATVSVLYSRSGRQRAQVVQSCILNRKSHTTVFDIIIDGTQLDEIASVSRLEDLLSSSSMVVVIFDDDLLQSDYFQNFVVPLVNYCCRPGRAELAIICDDEIDHTVETQFKSSSTLVVPNDVVSPQEFDNIEKFLMQVTGHAKSILPSPDIDQIPALGSSARQAIRFARPNIVVVDAILEATRYLQRNIQEREAPEFEFHRLPWDDSVLMALNANLIDMAIFNDHSYSRQASSYKDVVPLRPMGHSMGGNNFFVLSRDQELRSVPYAEWPKKLAGKRIASPVGADVLHSLCLLLGVDETVLAQYDVEIIGIDNKTTAEDILSWSPSLVLGSQNVRFSSKLREKGYLEIANRSSFPAPLANALFYGSMNSVFTNTAAAGRFGRTELLSVANDIWKNFELVRNNKEQYGELLDSLSEDMVMSKAKQVIKLIVGSSYD